MNELIREYRDLGWDSVRLNLTFGLSLICSNREEELVKVFVTKDCVTRTWICTGVLDIEIQGNKRITPEMVLKLEEILG